MKNTEMAVALAAATCTNVQQMIVVESVYDLLPTTQLTQHFSLREFIISATAIRHGIDNTPSEETVARLKALCDNVLEPLRRRFGRIRITSGYRSPSVNAKVGGVATSQHTLGEAADINVPNAEVGMKMYDYIGATSTSTSLSTNKGVRQLRGGCSELPHRRQQPSASMD